MTWFFTTRLGRTFVALGAFALFVLKFAKLRNTARELKDEVKAHERINDADTGVGATDGERVKRLREIAAKLRD